MSYTPDEILQYIEEEDVKFIRLAFCDVFGTPKNISIMPNEMKRAFEQGISIDASAIAGFGEESHSDMLLIPDPSEISILPWRPEHGRVVRMFCTVCNPDGTVFEADTRSLLKKTAEELESSGFDFNFGPETEFYLFRQDENGEPTKIPYDHAGYMDLAPEDKGENVRREICLTLEQMGIVPESSHHEEGPSQNKIDFRYSDALTAADHAITFRSVVKTIAARNGLYADFSPKPLANLPGNGMHINISAVYNGEDVLSYATAGILKHISEITLFLNSQPDSYKRFGFNKAPLYISWSEQNRSQLIRIPATMREYKRAELRSPDPMCNPYLALLLLMKAMEDGIRNKLPLCEPTDINLFKATPKELSGFETLPRSLSEAATAAKNSEFVRSSIPQSIIDDYTSK
ncbi:MAG: glutamine synthetase family protein [Oscillospiraceae bacterium]|nr:glutamine synthetase family protein [Oscillospiraceae bacterium]